MNKFKNPIIDYAVLFCGGRGTRLGSIGKKKNKSLILVKNKPIIFYIVSKLLKSNIAKIIFPLGYKGGDVKRYIQKKFSKHIDKFIFVNTGINSELSKRLVKIKKYLSNDKRVLMVNGDTIFDFNLLNFAKSHIISTKKISLASFNPKIDLGFILMKNNKPYEFKKSEFISEFKNKKFKLNAYSGFVILDTNILKNFKFTIKEDFEKELYNYYIKLNDINVFEITNRTCFPIDNVKNLNYANNNLILKN
jgi:glucose-1-phosphate cytidylyltransferase